MTEKEMKQVLELHDDLTHTTGTILGQLDDKAVCLPENSRMNKNIAVYGASGSMKSRAFARNMIFQCVRRGESLIINDPKSELYEDMSMYLENSGYCVKIFNLVNPETSDSWNFVSDIGGQDLLAQLSSDIIIKNTSSGKADHFWDSSEQNLLKALILYVATTYPEDSRNMESIYQLLITSTEEELRTIFSLLPADHPAKAPFSLFLRPSPSVRGDIMQGLGSRLQVFQNKLICQITAHNEIDLIQPGKEKCAIFLITSDQDSTFDFLSALFMNFVFIRLVRYADSFGENGKLPVPVHILADELANTGAILDLPKKISTIRSRNLSVSCIFQNIAQMQNRYPNNQWLEIIGNCDTQLFLGCTDELTATFISNRTGEISIDVSSQSRHVHPWQLSDQASDLRETRSLGRRKLLTMDEVLRFPLDQALIILRGQKVLQVAKFDYTLHPDSKKLLKNPVKNHIPDWKAKKSAAFPKSSVHEAHQTTRIPNIPIQPSNSANDAPVMSDEIYFTAADKASILS